MEKLLEALGECGEAAAFYENQNILAVNKPFADLFERSPKEFTGKPLIEICHNDSIEMIQDFIHRRLHHDSDVPITYECAFTTPSKPKIMLRVIALMFKKCGRSVLLLLREI